MSSHIEALGTERVLERVRARSTMTCDAEHFTVTSSLDAFADEVRVCARTFVHRFPRDGA